MTFLRRCPSTHYEIVTILLVTIAERPHPFPFRIRSLSFPAPMVLEGQLSGRVGRRQLTFLLRGLEPQALALFFYWPSATEHGGFNSRNDLRAVNHALIEQARADF